MGAQARRIRSNFDGVMGTWDYKEGIIPEAFMIHSVFLPAAMLPTAPSYKASRIS